MGSSASFVPGPKLITDIGISRVFSGVQSGNLSSNINMVLHPDTFMLQYSDYKDSKYKVLAQAARLDFLSLNFAVSGRPHDHVRMFVDILSARTANFRKIPSGCVHFYIIKRLSCALQKSLFHNITLKIGLVSIQSSGPSASDPEITVSAILNSDYLNITEDFDQVLDDDDV